MPINLFGWDTVSVVSIHSVNQALAANAGDLLLYFDYTDSSATIVGKFAPWRIEATPSASLIRIALPLLDCRLTIAGGQELQVSGISVIVEAPLKIMPAHSGKIGSELRFDFARGAGEETDSGIRYVETLDPDRKTDPLTSAVLGNAVANCLAANGEKVAFVFASIGAASPTGFDWLAPKASQWCQIHTNDGPGYLAILGSCSGVEKERAVDSRIIANSPNLTYLFASRLFVRNILLNYMNDSFAKGSRFHTSGSEVILSKRLALPSKKLSWVYTARPWIDSMNLYLSSGKLVVVTKGDMNLPLGASMTYSVTARMPFHFDPSSKHISFKRDEKPEVQTSVKLVPALDFVLGWFVRWIVSFFENAIDQPLRQVSLAMQSVSSPPPALIGWNGVRSFDVTHAYLDDSFVFIDGNQ